LVAAAIIVITVGVVTIATPILQGEAVVAAEVASVTMKRMFFVAVELEEGAAVVVEVMPLAAQTPTATEIDVNAIPNKHHMNVVKANCRQD